MNYGADLSRWNGDVNFKKLYDELKLDCPDPFVMLRIGGADGSEYFKDEKFDVNYEAALKVGFHIGAYYFSNAGNFTNWQDEFEHFNSLAKPYAFDYPLALDIEPPAASYKVRSQDIKPRTDKVLNIGAAMEGAGHYFIIYSSSQLGFKNMLDLSRLDRFDLWVAAWSDSAPEMFQTGRAGMWQCSSTDRLYGINGDVDFNQSRRDYPKIIRDMQASKTPISEFKKVDSATLIEFKEVLEKEIKKINIILNQED